jgi:hypothetical protein
MRSIWFAAAAAGLAGTAAAYAAAGPRGAVIAGTILATGAVLIARGTVPPGPRRAGRRRAETAAVQATDFPGHGRISSGVSWAGTSRRHYDRITRPILVRLVGAALEERHRVDIRRQPDEARRLVGEDLWPLVDPSAPASDDSEGPGVGLATLARITDILEQL